MSLGAAAPVDVVVPVPMVERPLAFVAVAHATPAKRLSAALMEENLAIRWSTGARLDKDFSPGICDLMTQSGCTRIDFGVESGDEKTLKRMHKGYSVEEYEATFENFRTKGINCHFYLIIDFPGESTESFANSIDFIIRSYVEIELKGMLARMAYTLSLL